MIATPDRIPMSPADYLAWEEQQEQRYEYLDGMVYPRNDILGMAGGTLPHNDIALNLYTALRAPMRRRGCRVNVADVKVCISAEGRDNGAFFYPDLLVSCHPQDLSALKFVQHPTVIVEVLSPATESYDRGAKFAQYRRLDSLREYLLISSDRINVELFRLNERRRWELIPLGPGDTLELSSLDFSCPVALLYDAVALTPQEP